MLPANRLVDDTGAECIEVSTGGWALIKVARTIATMVFS
jgi:hypothetical protein